MRAIAAAAVVALLLMASAGSAQAEGVVPPDSSWRELPGCPRTEATFAAAPVPANPENFAAARAGIEALPYEIDLEHARGAQNALIGTVHGNLGESFRFFLFVNRKPAKRLRKEPDYGTHGPNNELPDRGLEGGQLANTDYLFSHGGPAQGRPQPPGQRPLRDPGGHQRHDLRSTDRATLSVSAIGPISSFL